MAVQAKTTSCWQDIVGVVRALGVRAGLQPGDKAGKPLLIAAVAARVDRHEAEQALKAAGVRDVQAFLAAIPDVSHDNLDRLPELKADGKLASVITNELAGFVAGEVGPATALEILLSPELADRDVRRFLADPKTLFGGRAADPFRTSEDFLRELAGHYQARFHAGYRRYTVDASRGYSGFLDKDKGDGLAKAAEELRNAERHANQTVFASSLYERSPLGYCRQHYGELEAHILGATILGEMTLVAQGPLTVNALAWAVDPYRYHRLAGLVRDKVGYLRDEELLTVHPDDVVRLSSHVLAAPAIMADWLTFLRESDPITDAEIAETLESMP